MFSINDIIHDMHKANLQSTIYVFNTGLLCD